jgi:hypothetical protein
MNYRLPPLLIVITLLLLSGCVPTAMIVHDPVERYQTVRVGDPLQTQVAGLPADLKQALADRGLDYMTAADSAELNDFKRWLTSEFFLTCQVPTSVPPDNLVNQYHQLAGRSWYLRHILLADSMTAVKIEKALESNADFDSLATENSLDPGSARQGGVLPPTHLAETVFAFEQAFLNLEPGEMSSPVATPFGWHLIRLDSLVDCDTVYKSDDEIVAHLERSLHNKATRNYLTGLYHKYNVVFKEDNWGSRAPVAVWDECLSQTENLQCLLLQRGEYLSEGRRCVSGVGLDSMLQVAFSGKIDVASLDDTFRLDFLRHYIDQEFLYRQSITTGFCATSEVQQALVRKLTLTRASATVRELLQPDEASVKDIPPPEQLWELLKKE